MKRLRDEYLNLSDKAKNKETECSRSEQAYFDEQAGILAERLADGEPCPVCGATEHPLKAKLSGVAPTKDELDRLRAETDSLRAEREKKAAECSQLGGELKTLLDTIKSSANVSEVVESSIDIVAKETSEKLSSLESERNRLIANIKQIELQLIERAKLETEVKKEEEKIKELNEKCNKLKEERITKEAEKAQLEKNAEKHREKLSYSTKAEVLATIAEYKRKVKEADELMTAAKKTESDIMLALAETAANIKGWTQELENVTKADSEEINKEIAKLQKDKELNLRVINNLSNRQAHNKALTVKMQSVSVKAAKLEERYKMLKELNDTAAGTITGKEKIPLEIYVQMQYFERVLSRANVRLMAITDGQYELKRSEVGANKQEKSGLELNVVDHYNGTERSVRTLSGGESFIASLSLALGLSDEIQARAGGIELETMYIDEGFGTLDENLLNTAIMAINNLAENNKLIGIISHVAELKNRIEKQIQITKDQSGSRLKVVT